MELSLSLGAAEQSSNPFRKFLMLSSSNQQNSVNIFLLASYNGICTFDGI